jgi:hypothetical protein
LFDAAQYRADLEAIKSLDEVVPDEDTVKAVSNYRADLEAIGDDGLADYAPNEDEIKEVAAGTCECPASR